MYDPRRLPLPYNVAPVDDDQGPHRLNSPGIYQWRGPVDIHGVPVQLPVLAPIQATPPSPVNVIRGAVPPACSRPRGPATDRSLLPTQTGKGNVKTPIGRTSQQADAGYRTLAAKPRYTAEEDLFIRVARAENIPWNCVAIVLKDRYQHADNRNSKNLQVHFSQKINPTVATTEQLTSDETAHLEDWLAARLGTLYAGVAEEFNRTTLKLVDPRFVQSYAQGWKARTMQDLEESLVMARSMVDSRKKSRAAKKRRSSEKP